MAWGAFPSENGLDFRIDGNVRLRKAVDVVVCSPGALKMEIAADVVILVEDIERLLRILARDAEIGKRHVLAVSARDSNVSSNQFAQGHCRPSEGKPKHQ